MILRSTISKALQDFRSKSREEIKSLEVKRGQNVSFTIDLSTTNKNRKKTFSGMVIAKKDNYVRVIRSGSQVDMKIDLRSPVLTDIRVSSSVRHKVRKAKAYYMRTASKNSLKN